MGSNKKKNTVEESPFATKAARRLSMASVNTHSRTPTPGSVWINQSSVLSKPKETIRPTGDYTYSPSTHSPSRRITRSITILSDSKDEVDKINNVRSSHNTAIDVKMKSHIKNDFKRQMETEDIECFENSHMDKRHKRQVEILAIDSSSKKKKTDPLHISQVSEFYIPKENRFGGSINVLFEKNVISKLNNKMNEAQKELFKRTCFGHFLEMREMRLQHQVIHKFLLMEVRQSTHDEMWFKVAGKHLKFSVEDFALTSGLKCHGDDNTNVFKLGHSRIKHLFFKHKKNVYRKDVENIFNNLPASTSDEDVVKLGALYLISSFLYTTTSANVVPHEYFRIIESPHMDTYPWGKELFQITYMYLKLALAKTNPLLDDPKGIMSYRLHGFPLAFQIWIYESIPSLAGKVCTRVGRKSPRILNWSTDDSRIYAAYLDRILFNVDEVEVVMIQPTDEEKMVAYYQGLSQRERITIPSTIAAGADLVNDPAHIAKDHNHASSSNPKSFRTNKHQVAQDTSKMGEPPIIPVLEHLMNQMVEIRASQAQIIDSQNELKVDVNRIEQSVETNYTALLTMFVRAKKHSPHDKDKHDHIVDQSNEAQTIDNKNGNNRDKSVTPTIDGMVSKKNKQTSENHSDTPQDDSNPASSKCLTVVTKDSTQIDETDYINYTEEDLIQVDEIIKSATSTKLNSANQVDGSQTRLSRLQVSNEFGKDVFVQELFPTKNSSWLPPRTCVIDNAMGNLDESTYNMNAFNEEMEPQNDDDVEIFYEWFNDGYRAGHIKSKFPPKKDNLKPPFQFGPYTVESKTWWHELCHPNVHLKDSHVNVCFYYFRKMLKVSNIKSFKCTTTDSFFGSMVRFAYKTCKDDIQEISKFKSLVEYANGDYMHCNTRWSDVEHILIPIMMDKKAHWILGHFDIKERALYVYNSSRLTVRDRMVVADVEAFAYILPCLMVNIKDWQPNIVDVFERIEPLAVKIVSDIPQDEHG